MITDYVIKLTEINQVQNSGNYHEIEFHEIEITIFHEINSSAKLIMRSKLTFCKNDHEIEMALGALRWLGLVRSGVRLG